MITRVRGLKGRKRSRNARPRKALAACAQLEASHSLALG